MGSDKCVIPVGVIRQACALFGVVVETSEGQKLLARREPGDQQSTGDMVLIEGIEIEVPLKILEKNTNVDSVKEMLNRLSGLTSLAFDPESESPFKSRPSFRDLVAFNFQPQNIVANPNVLFFKADTTEHREKLKTIFPYVLGAIDADVLQNRFELDRLQRLFRRKESELRVLAANIAVWQSESQSWLRQAVELGLLPPNQTISLEWPVLVDVLRQSIRGDLRSITPTLEGLDVVLSRLRELRGREVEKATELTICRQRLNELKRLTESSEAYGGAIRVQRDRLALADWLRSLDQDIRDPVVVLAEGERSQLALLCQTLENLELQIRTQPAMTETLDRETQRRRSEAENLLAELSGIRTEIVDLERTSEAVHAERDRFYRVERFVGKLEQMLLFYDRISESTELRAEVHDISLRIAELRKMVSETDIARRTVTAINRIQGLTDNLVPQLDAEWQSAPIRLSIDDLTIKVLRDKREDFLWEIGSGANWLAYHVAMTLALQKFFLMEAFAPVPHLLIYDQPSQVYFPQRAVERETPLDPEWNDQDVAAVRKVFILLGKEVVAAGSRLQIIVLDHADEDVWGGIAGVKLSEEWRGSVALIPLDWID